MPGVYFQEVYGYGSIMEFLLYNSGLCIVRSVKIALAVKGLMCTLQHRELLIGPNSEKREEKSHQRASLASLDSARLYYGEVLFAARLDRGPCVSDFCNFF